MRLNWNMVFNSKTNMLQLQMGIGLCKQSRAGLKEKCPERCIAQESDPQNQLSCPPHLLLLAYAA